MDSDRVNPVLPIFSETFEDLNRAVDERKGIDVIYLDYKKAFDSVPHQRLLCELQGYGITGKLLNWIQGFLCNRLQRVVFDGRSSDWCCVKSGVPQG